MKLVTWNVNSLKVRLPHLLQWLDQHHPDAIGLQELKLENAAFPVKALREVGYHAVFLGQKTYNGVAILSPTPADDVTYGLPGQEDQQSRLIAATLSGVRVVCVYVPNGQSLESDKYTYKLRWLEQLHIWLSAELTRYPQLALMGDFNIAPEDRDVHDPKAWAGQVLVSDAERAALHKITALGLTDVYRCFEQPEKSYSWWDYRMNGFRRNLGLRIDHILTSTPLTAQCVSCTIDKEPRRLERPSDHAPVVATFAR